MLTIKSIDLDLHTIEWKGGDKTVIHQDMRKPTLSGAVIHPDGTQADFVTPLTADEQKALQALLDTIVARVRGTLS